MHRFGRKLQLRLAQCKDSTQDQGTNAIGVGLRVGKRERGTPRPAKDVPFGDVELLTKLFDVVDEMPGGVIHEVGVRRRLARSTLIERENAIVGGVKPASFLRPDSTARSTVQADNRLAVGFATPLVVDRVPIVHSQSSGVVRLDGRVRLTKGRLVIREGARGGGVVDHIGGVKAELGLVVGRHLGAGFGGGSEPREDARGRLRGGLRRQRRQNALREESLREGH